LHRYRLADPIALERVRLKTHEAPSIHPRLGGQRFFDDISRLARVAAKAQGSRLPVAQATRELEAMAAAQRSRTETNAAAIAATPRERISFDICTDGSHSMLV
jgi:hypothetical protein